MSAFKVGDRVFDKTIQHSANGTVTAVRADVCVVEWDTEISCPYPHGDLALVAPAPPVAVAPTLETAAGIKVGTRVRNIFDLIGTVVESDGRRFAVKWDGLDGVNHDFGASELWRVVPGLDGKYATPGVTQAEWSEAIAKINAQAKALDTVRRFLGGHSFASCSLACNRELREVMAQVLAALDSDKAFK